MDYEKVNLLLQIWKATLEIREMYNRKAEPQQIIHLLAETRVFAGAELDRLIKEQLAKEPDPTVK